MSDAYTPGPQPKVKLSEMWTIEVGRGDLERLLVNACNHLSDCTHNSDLYGDGWGDEAERLLGRITELVRTLANK
jgi:hypothetical protein